MNGKLGACFTILIFLGSIGAIPAFASSASTAAARNPVEVTGCLKQGPAAKEYLLRTADGKTWGIIETNMMMNNYLDHSVTIAGNLMRPTADERAAGGAQHFLRAYDLVVESDSCKQ